jgi:methylenetetrahydrofolate dehydrogenase (NADP+)/methenyltetrahydrofolate cyclohydrolase
MTVVIDGKKVSAEIRNSIKKEVSELNNNGKTVGLAVIIIGNDKASEVYVKNKINACAETGVISFHYALPETVKQNDVIDLINKLNADKKVNGILVQLPLPKSLDKTAIMSAIDVKKDVDGFSAYQSGKMFLGEKSLVSCTPKGIIALLKAYNIELQGKRAVVVGRSNIVGKPTAMLLLNENATVTVCHSKTVNLKEITLAADIIVTAVGKVAFITADMVKDGAVVIDAGINRDQNGKLCGDVDFERVAPKCSYITPVPGGVGPMTVTMLLENTLAAAKYE